MFVGTKETKECGQLSEWLPVGEGCGPVGETALRAV